jgi:hypothetical protein
MHIWILVSVVLGLLWFVTMLAWWLSRRSRKSPPRESATPPARPPTRSAAQARTEFRDACRRNDAHAARRALLAWTHAAWAHEPALGLEALAKRIDDVNVSARLLELDRACFAGAAWDGAALSQALKDLPAVAVRAGAAGDGPAPLYPG